MLRGLAIQVGRALGAASACPNIARPRIDGISGKIKSIIKSSAAGTDEVTAIIELLNKSESEGARSVAANQVGCTAAERQLADLESVSTPTPQSNAPASAAAQPLGLIGSVAPAAPLGLPSWIRDGAVV